MIKKILCDLDGVIYNQGHMIEGILEALEYIRSKSVDIKFITNNSTKTQNQILESLYNLGLTIGLDQLITPLSIAVGMITSTNSRVSLCLRSELRAQFSGFIDEDNPDWVVIGDVGDSWNAQLLNDIYSKVEAGAGIIALHKNAVALDRYNQKVLDIGAYIAALEYSTRKEAVVIGKPSSKFFNAAMSSFGSIETHEVLMIGDDLYADIEGAMLVGLKTCLVLSGKTSIKNYQNTKIKPDFILSSLADIHEII